MSFPARGAKARPGPSAAPLAGFPGLTTVGHLGGWAGTVGKLSDWYVKSSTVNMLNIVNPGQVLLYRVP